MRQANPGLVAATALTSLLSLYLKGIVWRVFLRPLDVESTAGPLRAHFAGAALNNILPWNSGDAIRVWAYASQRGLPFLRVLGTAGLERLTGLTSASCSWGPRWPWPPCPGFRARWGKGTNHERLAHVDGLRILALEGVFLVHVGVVFNPYAPWHIQDAVRPAMIGQLVAFLAPWVMPLFMLLAGVSAWYSLRRRSATWSGMVGRGVSLHLATPLDSLAAMHTVLIDGELGARMGRNGRVRALEFSWPRVAHHVHQVYARLLGRSGRVEAAPG